MRKKKLLAIVGVFFGSPICAEYLQAYLSFTGDAGWLLVGLFFFAPLYGAAALLIREAAVRSGRGWVGILLLAGAFGILMPGVIDLAMYGEQRSDIPYWNDIRRQTLIPALGLSAFAMSTWVFGRVVMSIGTPLASRRVGPFVTRQATPAVVGDPVARRRGVRLVRPSGRAHNLWLRAQHGPGRIRD